MKTLFLVLAIVVSIAFTPSYAETPIPGIDDTWTSFSCELRPQVGQDGSVQPWYLTRKITFKDNRIEADFQTYGDKSCSFPLVKLAFAGRVEVLGQSDVANGKAYKANLTIDEFVQITPMADPFVEFVSAAGCGGNEVKLGKTMDVMQSGCEALGLKPNNVTVEYEVLMVENDNLYFGARPVNGKLLASPDDRPTALQVPLKRE